MAGYHPAIGHWASGLVLLLSVHAEIRRFGGLVSGAGGEGGEILEENKKDKEVAYAPGCRQVQALSAEHCCEIRGHAADRIERTVRQSERDEQSTRRQIPTASMYSYQQVRI